MLRHLRVLPIPAAQLNALLLIWPALIWLAAWVAASVLHVVVLGHPPQQPHAPSVLALIGVSSLAQAACLRLATVTRIFNFAALAGLLPFAGLISPPSPAVLAVFGIVAIAGAAVLNRMALANGATYRVTLGALFGAPPDPR